MDTSKPGMYMGGLSPSNFVALVQNARVSYSIMRDVWKDTSMAQLCQKYHLAPDVLFSRVATTGAQLAQLVTMQVINNEELIFEIMAINNLGKGLSMTESVKEAEGRRAYAHQLKVSEVVGEWPQGDPKYQLKWRPAPHLPSGGGYF